MHSPRLTLLCLPLIACGTDVVQVLESMDSGTTDTQIEPEEDASLSDTGTADSGADTGVDTGVETDAGCVLQNAVVDVLDYDGARSGPRTEARPDVFAVLREGDITRHDSYTPELHLYTLDDEKIGESVHFDVSGSYGVLSLSRMGTDFGIGVILEWTPWFAFKPGVAANATAVIVETSTTIARGAAAMTEDRIYYTTHDLDGEHHVVHVRGIHDDFAASHPVGATDFGFPAYDPKLFTFNGEIWLSYVQDFDFPRMVMLEAIGDDGMGGGPQLWTVGCGVDSYDVAFVDLDTVAVVADCFDRTVLGVYRRSSTGPVGYVEIFDAPMLVPSQVAWDQRSLGVVFWPSGASEPKIRFYDLDGTAKSNTINLPPLAIDGTAIGMDASATRAAGETPRWVVAYTHTVPPSIRGTTYVNRFDGCP
jgi:hypothetical protein